MEETYQLWLAAVPSPVPEDEARINWNCKDDPTPALDEGLRCASYLYVGSWGDEHEPENLHAGQGHCSTNRLFSWLFYIGTIDRYQVPLLDEELMARLVELYRPRPGDRPAEAIELPRLESFLRQHLGRYLLPQEVGPSQNGLYASDNVSGGSAREKDTYTGPSGVSVCKFSH